MQGKQGHLGPGRNGLRRTYLACLLVALTLPLGAAEVERGGSFCVVPAVLMPAGRLDLAYHPAPQVNLDFDVGINPRWSVIFGAGFSDHESKLNPDARLVLAPTWFGFKSKAQILPAVELFWDFAGELTYEKAYFRGSGIGSIENLDGGVLLGAGFDLWLTQWLLVGVESKAHLLIEAGEVFPMVQLGLRLGIRG